MKLTAVTKWIDGRSYLSDTDGDAVLPGGAGGGPVGEGQLFRVIQGCVNYINIGCSPIILARITAKAAADQARIIEHPICFTKKVVYKT